MKLPARSTVDAVLKRAGVVSPRKCRKRRARNGPPVVEAVAPNDVWSIDYKGWFKVGDGTRCDPLTVNDVFSRMSLECRALVSPKLADVQNRLKSLFRERGLPRVMLSDNGPPFGSRGLGGLSRLGVWLLRLNVRPVFIEPGHPEQNGRHERFHETLKAETATPPRRSIRAQQAAFDSFQSEYNEERPHEALNMKAPAELYEPSERPMPTVLPEHEYDDSLDIRRVDRNGTMKWSAEKFFVGVPGHLPWPGSLDVTHVPGHVCPSRVARALHNLSVSSPWTPSSRGLRPRNAALRLSSARAPLRAAPPEKEARAASRLRLDEQGS